MCEISTTSVLDQLLDPVADCLTPEVARRIVELRISAAMQLRIDELAAKANEGTLSVQERAEYEEYVEGIDLVGILKAKARMAINKHSS